MGHELPPTAGRRPWTTLGLAVVVGVALTQAAITASTRYDSGRRSIHDFLDRAAKVVPLHATYTTLWVGQSPKPAHDAKYVLYPRRSIRVSAKHTVKLPTARSELRAAGVEYVLVLVERRQTNRGAKLAAALAEPWSHLILRTDRGEVYRVEP